MTKMNINTKRYIESFIKIRNKEGKIDKYVTPYRLNMNFGYDAEGRTTAYNYDYNPGAIEITGGTLNTIDDQILYLADVPETTEGAHVQDTFSAYSLYINCNNGVLSEAKVRQALSVALDRTKIAGMLNATEAATGLVTKPVFATTLGGQTFRDLAGNTVSPSADEAKAKSLLSEAGVKSGKITYTYYKGRDGAAAVAEYVKSVWEGLGFTVELDEKGINQYSNKLIADADTGEYDFDVLALDYHSLSTNAFSVLAPFAVPFSGSAKDTAHNDFSDKPSMSGYASDAYDALIEEAYAAETRDAMAAKLVEAEKLLMTDCPIIPLVFNKDTYIYSQTTKSLEGYSLIVNEIKERIDSCRKCESFNTVCGQVANRLNGISEFAKSHDIIFFVCGKKSSNGKILFNECRKVNPNSHQIEGPEEIDLTLIKGNENIGICGATSTPKWLMEECKQAIMNQKQHIV